VHSIAIITDIHGNAPALEAVLKEISGRGIPQIVCLGDVVGIGPDSNRVFELLLAQEHISYVSGNHDLAVLAAFRKEAAPPGHQAERSHHEWLAERMNPEYLEMISRWPMSIRAVIEEVSMLFTHYHLGKDNWYRPIDPSPAAETLEQQYAGTDYRLVAFGHHHVVHQYASERRMFFNPGSLGCPHSAEAIARYGIVHIGNGRVRAEVREIPYDNTDFIASYEELNVPDKDFILRIFHGRDV